MRAQRSSSNRVTEINDAVLVKDQRAVGPMRLPENRAEDFIDQFNRTYGGLGMKLALVAAEVNKKIPGSIAAAGDDRSGSFGQRPKSFLEG